jgi:hypothetical protein
MIHFVVMAGLDPAIHVFAHSAGPWQSPWMPGSSPGMTSWLVPCTI